MPTTDDWWYSAGYVPYLYTDERFINIMCLYDHEYHGLLAEKITRNVENEVIEVLICFRKIRIRVAIVSFLLREKIIQVYIYKTKYFLPHSYCHSRGVESEITIRWLKMF